MKIEISEARKIFSKLLKAAENGEVVTFCRDGVPVADMIQTTSPRVFTKLKKSKKKQSAKRG